MIAGKKTKVLFLPVWYPSKFDKVLGIFVKQHAIALNNSVNLAVYHVCPHLGLNSIIKFEEVREDGLLVYRAYYWLFQIKVLKPLNWITYFFAGFIGYLKILNSWGRPDINHIHVLTRVGVIALFAKAFQKTPYYITEHWSRYLPERNTYKGFLRKFLTKLIVSKSSGISTVSECLKIALQKHELFHENFPIIPNTVNFNIFKPTTGSFNHQCFRFLHVSGLTDRTKNISGIINACKILKSESVLFSLHIVGNYKNKQSLLHYVRELGLESNIHFKGELYGEQLAAEYRKADTFVLFSFFESQSVVLIESFSSGVPVIATASGGIPEIVNTENGILTPPGDEKLLAKNMKQMIKNKHLYKKDIIRAEAKARFSYEKVADQFIKFYT